MKKVILLAVFVIVAGTTFGQALQKGNLLGIHTLTIEPNPDVTLNQYMDFFMNKYIPKYEECFPGLKIKVLKGNRGENENSFGLLLFLDSVEARDKYWPKKDEWSELAQQGYEKLEPTYQELMKLGTWYSVHTDWVIQ